MAAIDCHHVRFLVEDQCLTDVGELLCYTGRIVDDEIAMDMRPRRWVRRNNVSDLADLGEDHSDARLETHQHGDRSPVPVDGFLSFADDMSSGPRDSVARVSSFLHGKARFLFSSELSPEII
jgi:hypothetical protein